MLARFRIRSERHQSKSLLVDRKTRALGLDETPATSSSWEKCTEIQNKEMMQKLATLRHTHGDVILVCDDVELPVHKFILVAGCPYFETMCQSSYKDANSNRLRLEFPSDIVVQVVNFIYQQPLTVDSKDDFIELLRAASFLCMDDLMHQCCVNILSKTSVEDFDLVMNLHEVYNNKETKFIMMEFLKSHCLLLMSLPIFLELDYLQFKTAVEAASATAALHEDLCLVIMRWVEKHPTGVNYLLELFSLIDFQMLSKTFVADLVKKDTIKNNGELMALLFEKCFSTDTSSNSRVHSVYPGCRSPIYRFRDYDDYDSPVSIGCDDDYYSDGDKGWDS